MTETTPEATPADDSSSGESVFDSIDPALKVVSAELGISAPASEVFELIADPARQPEWDGNDNLGSAVGGQRVTAAGSSFITTLTKGVEREYHVVEFDDGRLIAWMPSEVGGEPFGQKWKWEVESTGEDSSLVRQTYDWTELRDPKRLSRAQSTTSDKLLASMVRLKALVEG